MGPSLMFLLLPAPRQCQASVAAYSEVLSQVSPATPQQADPVSSTPIATTSAGSNFRPAKAPFPSQRAATMRCLSWSWSFHLRRLVTNVQGVLTLPARTFDAPRLTSRLSVSGRMPHLFLLDFQWMSTQRLRGWHGGVQRRGGKLRRRETGWLTRRGRPGSSYSRCGTSAWQFVLILRRCSAMTASLSRLS